jgi:hypothetical protein
MIGVNSRLWRLIFVALWVVTAGATAKQWRSSSFSLAKQSNEGWTVDYVPAPTPSSLVDVDGVQHVAYSIDANSEDGSEGKPQLPVDVIGIGIPSDGAVTVDLVNPVYDSQRNVLIAPKPGYRYTDEKEAVALYKKSPVSYSENKFVPAQQIAVDRPYILRRQRIVTVRIMPYQYNPATKTLRRLVRGTLSISLTSSLGKKEIIGAGSDPYFEEVYRSLLLNYEQAKAWRIPGPAPTSALADSTRDWFETGRTYYKILIAADGWYKVTKASLIAAGANPSSIDTSTMRLFGRGVQVPIVVRPDTSIEFYGVRNYGDSTYFDFYTDTSTYFLTWGGVQGSRYGATQQPVGNANLLLTSSRVVKHFEENTAYYTGADQSEIIENGVVPGEGWVWDYFYPGTTMTYQFSLDSVDVAGGPNAALRARMFGTTSPIVTHDAKFWINDSLAGEAIFPQRSEGRLAVSFPSSWLHKGINSLKISSIPTQPAINQFYLDWFEVDYQRVLTAQNDRLFFASPSSSSGGIARFTVGGFSNAQIEVFDVRSGRQISGGTVAGDSVAGFSIAFKDTFSTARNYIVVCPSGTGSPPALIPKSFSDIRANAMGADYVILTHKFFLDAARSLATHRQNVNGVRATVVDVQDIYDEFNYGIMNATKIKTFFRYAYQNWPAPALTHVLMFGDASWDFHRYLSTTTTTNYVPAYGVPAGDNWFGCFDTVQTFLPSLLFGRITVQNPAQAQRVVAKVAGYDSYALGDWNKNYLMISGGSNASEWSTFNFLSDNTINSYIAPAPLGGTPSRVYKSTIAVIDGEHKQEILDLIKKGVVVLNFLGHSGGRVWGVDVGPPDNFENTTGMLPFVSSVSCDVGAFAEPSGNVLSEDFVLADNRGAIACWGASSLGYAFQGQSLLNYFLSEAANDSLRYFGALTTTARFKLWQNQGGGQLNRALVNLTPLIGDPLSRLAIPLKPDLAVSPNDITFNTPTPTPNDTSLTLKVMYRNYGLVPTDSVAISVADLFDGHSSDILHNVKIPRTYYTDSLAVLWKATSQVGVHTLTVTLDPANVLPEVTKSNNVASVNQYIYANDIAVVKPLGNMVVAPGVQSLIVTSPVGLDSSGFQYFFELDTLATFDSPFHMMSGAIIPGPVSGQWQTPPLQGGQVFFWRARTAYGQLLGNWVTSSFSTSIDAPALPTVRVREYSPRQFLRDIANQASPTDSGVTIVPNPALSLFSKGLGYRALDFHDYSTIGINQQIIRGYWWDLGSGFMVARVNELTGGFDFRPFNVSGQASQGDSMRAYIKNTPIGNYLAATVIFDGRTNVSESLYVALESIGSTLIRQVQPGQSWGLIGRKGAAGPGMTALEGLTNDSVIVSTQIPNYYTVGSGSLSSPAISTPMSWGGFRWNQTGTQATNIRIAVLGVRSNGGTDTLRILPRDSLNVNLSPLNLLTSGPTYSSFRIAALFSTSDALVTPVLHDWLLEFIPSPDLAVSSRTIGVSNGLPQQGGTLNLAVPVYNIGYLGIDSARVVVSVYDKLNKARPIASAEIDTIPVNGFKTATIPINTTNFPRRATLQVSVSPSKRYKDLVADNNTAYFTFNVSGKSVSMAQVFADGVQLMDGDFVSAKPTISVRFPSIDEGRITRRQVEFFVDGKKVNPAGEVGPVDSRKSGPGLKEDFEILPDLPAGSHQLKITSVEVSSFGEQDTLEHALMVNVETTMRLLGLYNYPNPFRQDTYFTFVLTGSRPPEELSIRIFTIAGRKLKEIAVPAGSIQVGFNRVYWDGRDNDGDEIANGYYFYQVSFKSGGKTDSKIEKLVKLR